MRIINLTPHTINLMDAENRIIARYPSEGIARASSQRETAHTLDINGHTVNINRAVFGSVEGLPAPQPDTYYIVSAITAKAAYGRDDLILTDSSVRNEDGQIIGCRSFAIV